MFYYRPLSVSPVSLLSAPSSCLFPIPKPYQDLAAFSIFPFSKEMLLFCPVWEPIWTTYTQSGRTGLLETDLYAHWSSAGGHCVSFLNPGPEGSLYEGLRASVTSPFPLSFLPSAPLKGTSSIWSLLLRMEAGELFSRISQEQGRMGDPHVLRGE